MDKIKNIYENLTVDELKEAFLEIAEQKKTGILKNGIIRKIQKQIREIIKDNHFSMESVENAITWEISKRWYNGFYGVIEGFIKE